MNFLEDFKDVSIVHYFANFFVTMSILGAIKTGQIDLGIGAGYVHTFSRFSNWPLLYIFQTGPYSALI